jgi:outer membrane protein assembly factor BamB
VKAMYATLVASAVTALAWGGTALAAPGMQVINTIPAGSAQSMASFGAFGVTTALATDGDVTKPWLITLLNADVPGGASTSRVGPAGLIPTSRITEVKFSDAADAHPVAAIVGMSDGYVYRWDAETGACVWKTYIGRTTATVIHFPGCVGEIAPSDVQCPNESDAAGGELTATIDNDMGSASASTIFVPTAYAEVAAGGDVDACGTPSGNRVYALNAATGEPSWVFNTDTTSQTPYAAQTSPYAVGPIFGTPVRDTWDDGCSGGVNRAQLIVGAADPGGQDTLFAISTAVATGGALNWSGAAGDIQTSLAPGLLGYTMCHHLYANTASGGSFETIGPLLHRRAAPHLPLLAGGLRAERHLRRGSHHQDRPGRPERDPGVRRRRRHDIDLLQRHLAVDALPPRHEPPRALLHVHLVRRGRRRRGRRHRRALPARQAAGGSVRLRPRLRLVAAARHGRRGPLRRQHGHPRWDRPRDGRRLPVRLERDRRELH